MRRFLVYFFVSALLVLGGCAFQSDFFIPSRKQAVADSYSGRFEIVSGFEGKSFYTGVVKDKETGVEYFASIDRYGILTIGAIVLPAPAMLRPQE